MHRQPTTDAAAPVGAPEGTDRDDGGRLVTDGGTVAATEPPDQLPEEGPASAGTEAGEQSDGDATADGEVPADDEPGDLSLDVVFEIAKNERRRLALEYLRERDEPVSLSDLAEHIAAIENDKPERALSSAERKRVYVGLYQCHLPKMDGADVIDFERNPGISLGPNADQVLEYVAVDEDDQRPWNRYYLAESLVGTVAIAAAALVGGLVVALVSAVVLGALAATAVVHTLATEDGFDDVLPAGPRSRPEDA